MMHALSTPNTAPSLRRNGSTMARRSCPGRSCSSGSPPEAMEQHAACRHPPHPPRRHPNLQGVLMDTTLLQLLRIIQPGLQDPVPTLAGVLQEVDAHPTFAILVFGDDLCTKLLSQLGELAEPHTRTARHSFLCCPHQKIPLALHVVIHLHLLFQLVVVQGCHCAIQPPQ